MKKQQHRVEEIFIQALEIGVGPAREAYLDEACGGEENLREKVGKLVAAHEEPAAILGTLGGMGAPAGERAGDQIGNYKLLEEIGAGGMGVVYMAEQEEPVRRKVALKIIKLGMDTKQVVARFEAERQALAMMDSPHIAKLLDAGVTQTGRPYFVMELVRGIAITKFCQHNRISIEDRLKLFIAVCQAIQHAHQKGVIHRDIKPSNILVTRNGGVPHPMVIDFGVAKAINQRLTEKTLFTNFAQMIGTPTYMSPEQAEMSIQDVDTRSDVYSLGVLLYELMTGTTPFSEERLRSVGYAEMQRIIKEEEPLRPSTMVSQMADQGQASLARGNIEHITSIKAFKGDLDWIVLKAIEKDRKMRYETANGLAMDVRRHLDDKPVEAAAPTVGYRFQKYARRHKAAMLAGMAVAAALLVGTGVSVWHAVQADSARQREYEQKTAADAARGRAEAGERRALEGERKQRQFAYASDMKAAESALAEDDLGRASALLERYLPTPGENADDLRGIEWRYLWQASRGDEIETIPHNSIVDSVSLSDDGMRLASGTFGGEIQLFDLDSLERLRPFEGRPESLSPARASALSPDGRLLAAEKEGNLVVWDANSGAVVFENEEVIAPVAFSPDSGTLAARTEDGISLWDTRTWEHRTIVKHLSRLWNNAITFTPDGTRIVLKDTDVVMVWNLNSGAGPREFPVPDGVRLLSVAASSKYVASGTVGGQVLLWDLESGEPICEPFQAHLSRVDAMAFSPDGRTLATAGNDAVIHLWRPDTLAQTRTLKGHRSEIWDLRFSRDGQRLASASKDQTVKLWRTEAAPAGGTSHVIPKNLICRGLTESGEILRFTDPAEWQEHTEPRIWKPPLKEVKLRTDHLFNVITGQWSRAIRSDSEAILGATWLDCQSGQDSYLFGKNDGTVVLSDGKTFESVRVAEHGVRVQPLLLSPTDRYILVNVYPDGMEPHSILWDREVDDSVGSFSQAFSTTNTGPKFAISPDERFLAFVCADDDHAVGLWNIPERRDWATLRGHTSTVAGLEFSPDGRLLASFSYDATCRLWDVENGCAEKPHLLRGHRSGCYQATFSPDSRTLVTASDDTTCKFWSIATGQEVLSRKFSYSAKGYQFQSIPVMVPNADRLISPTNTNAGSVLEVITLPSLAEIDAKVSKRPKEAAAE